MTNVNQSARNEPKPLRVLLIEDSEDDALLAIRALKKGGYNPCYKRVETATDMQKALQYELWDVILSDYSMPGFNGMDALAILRKMNVDIPFIIISGAIGEETAVECMRLGAKDYIMKNNLSRLGSAIERELAEAKSRAKQKLMEEALRESEEKYRSIIENAQEGIYQSSPSGHWITINQAFANILGYESPEEVMASITNIDHQLYVNLSDRKKLLQLVAEHGSVKGYETEFYRKDGSHIWVSVNIHAVRDKNGRLLYYQGIDQDITEKKMMDAERQQNIDRLRKLLESTINAMAVTVETRDPYTAGHQRRVADLSRAIAIEMNLDDNQIDGLHLASIIHDLGKISIPSEILTKPTKLIDLEFSLIKIHPVSGYHILEDIDFYWPIARIVLEHHERMDGSGYPNGLMGDQILPESKIMAIADVVEAISSHRPYRASLGIAAALEEIVKNRGILYEPEAVNACLRLFEEKRFSFTA